MLNNEWIANSHTKYSSPVVATRKSDGSQYYTATEES